MNRLDKLDVGVELAKKEYRKTLEKLQLRITFLQRELRSKKIPLILAMEGWDASGKGGAIKRVTEKLDPRGLKVYPVGAPSDDELRHHYLWRFWSRLPRRGEIVIFDRTWYGRVLVERVEGFAQESEWKRAFEEINNFEKNLVDDGTLLMKFFIHVSKDEQLKRFQERAADPFKSWKITDEDWRNREKWDQYKIAIEDMFEKTDSKHCKWNIIAGNNKLYSRVTVLTTVIEAIEKHCDIDRKSLYPPSAQ